MASQVLTEAHFAKKYLSFEKNFYFCKVFEIYVKKEKKKENHESTDQNENDKFL